MKRVLSLVMAMIMLLSTASVAYAADVEEYAFDATYSDANPLKVGTYELTLDTAAEHTLYIFVPDEIGVYTFTVSEGATIGYWGAGSFYVSNPNSTATSIEREIKAVGQGAAIGIASENATVTLTIEKTAESEGVVTKVYTEWVNVHTPSADVVIPGGLVGVDITVPHTATLGMDGYYHIDGVNGPMLYVDLVTSEFNLSLLCGENGALTMRGHYNDGDWEFKNAMMAYDAAVATTGGWYPVTEDLAAFLQGYGTNQGWYNADLTIFAEIQAGTAHEDSAWLVNCAYEPVKAGTIDNPAKLQIGTNAAIFDGSEEDLYYYAYTAEEAGTLTFTVLGSNWQYMYDYTTYDYDWTPDENSQSVELAAGETVLIGIGTFNPEDFWSFPAGSVAVKAEFVATPVHVHALEKVEATPATCDENGTWEHYACQCGAIFEDAEGTVELTAEELVILPLGHERIELVEAVLPTCDVAGNIEYWCG